jgi:crossover junction endodeoxyribonuclease RusA
MITFFVPGLAAPQGSKKHVGNGVMVESSKNLRPWRDSVTWKAQDEIRIRRPWWPMTGAIEVTLDFVFPHPKSHYGTGRNAGVLKATAPLHKATKPDSDKLARAALDAIVAAGVLRDDAQVAELHVSKTYGDQPGLHVRVEAIH